MYFTHVSALRLLICILGTILSKVYCVAEFAKVSFFLSFFAAGIVDVYFGEVQC